MHNASFLPLQTVDIDKTRLIITFNLKKRNSIPINKLYTKLIWFQTYSPGLIKIQCSSNRFIQTRSSVCDNMFDFSRDFTHFQLSCNKGRITESISDICWKARKQRLGSLHVLCCFFFFSFRLVRSLKADPERFAQIFLTLSYSYFSNIGYLFQYWR